MGKNLKGKECGKGICQRKDGKYTARFTSKNGSRREKHFDTLPEARNWLADIQYEEKHGLVTASSDMTVDSWFSFWIDNLIVDLAPNTKRNYRERYRINIQPVIGNMRLCDVKPMHCKIVLNRMETTYAGSTIRQAYITMGTMFRAAVMNDMLIKHPMGGVRYTKPVRAVDDIKFLTVEEQKKFLEAAKRSHNYRQYALLLETGLRTSEMIGLTWDAIDWKKRTLTVSKTLEYRHGEGVWRAGPPKTASSYRTIPLTNQAYNILKSCYDERHTRKESKLLSQVLVWIVERGRPDTCVCGTWSLSTTAPANLPKTAPTIRTCISFATRPASDDFVCTPCGTPMPPVPSSGALCQKSCKGCSVTQASKPPWIAMYTLQTFPLSPP